MAYIIYGIIGACILRWFLHMLNKSPGEIQRLMWLREDKPDLFWSECIPYVATWIACLGLLIAFTIPVIVMISSGSGIRGLYEFVMGLAGYNVP